MTQAEPDSAERRIQGLDFLPVDADGRDLTGRVFERFDRRSMPECAFLPVPSRLEIPELPDRGQVDADGLLQQLEGMDRRGDTILVGVTTLDIASPLFTHFFGRARLGGHAVLVSLARLTPSFYGLPPDEPTTLHRAEREVLHELGHSGGLAHCRDYRCVMHFAANVEAIDLRGATYCPSCAADLPAGLRELGASEASQDLG